jgi:hypothetical protein
VRAVALRRSWFRTSPFAVVWAILVFGLFTVFSKGLPLMHPRVLAYHRGLMC